MTEAKRRPPACQRRRVSCQGVNVTGRATRGVPVARARCNTSGVTMARAHLGTKDCDHMW
jgi:hypothetical protein